ncbi:MAG: type II secretion system protein [Minisyncoccia bacterium]
MNGQSKAKGFTLIELLVVVAIISLLSSVVFASLNSAREKARDARRISDLHQIQVALEMYFNDYNRYPIATSWVYSYSSGWDTLQTALAPYIDSLPRDPINTAAGGPWSVGDYYNYAFLSNEALYPGKYDLVTKFEDEGNKNRCELKRWKFYTLGSEGVWCINWPYSNYLYADH